MHRCSRTKGLSGDWFSCASLTVRHPGVGGCQVEGAERPTDPRTDPTLQGRGVARDVLSPVVLEVSFQGCSFSVSDTVCAPDIYGGHAVQKLRHPECLS